MSKRQLKELQKAAGLVNLPTPLTHDLRLGVAGEGPYAYDWKDKPHRLVYTACAQIEANARLIAQAWLIPEMVEALRALAEILEHDCGCPPCEGSMAPAEHHLALAIAILARIDGGKS